MPVALAAFFESKDFDSSIRNVLSIGADSDTIAAITGSIAEAYYGGVPENDWVEAQKRLDWEMIKFIDWFYEPFMCKKETNE